MVSAFITKTLQELRNKASSSVLLVCNESDIFFSTIVNIDDPAKGSTTLFDQAALLT